MSHILKPRIGYRGGRELQGFEDVNKRVDRLAANIPLIRGKLCPLSFVDVPDRACIDGVPRDYELNRIELLRDVFCLGIGALQRATRPCASRWANPTPSARVTGHWSVRWSPP